MKYKVAAAKTLPELEAKVERHLKQGYKCQGGVVITGTPANSVVAQAMIKEE